MIELGDAFLALLLATVPFFIGYIVAVLGVDYIKKLL